MNLSSLSFLQRLYPKTQQFAVIGLGRFGRAVCESLHKAGSEVLGADSDPKQVAAVLSNNLASHAIELDSTDPIALKEAGIIEFDTVIIAIGNYLQESIITTLNLKEAGVAHVVAKASTEVHGKLLKRVGADVVVFPEYEAGCALAQSLTKPAILERFELDPEHSIVEVMAPAEFHHKTLAELELRSQYGLNVLAIGQDSKFEINPSPIQRLLPGMVLVVIGNNQCIEKLPI